MWDRLLPLIGKCCGIESSMRLAVARGLFSCPANHRINSICDVRVLQLSLLRSTLLSSAGFNPLGVVAELKAREFIACLHRSRHHDPGLPTRRLDPVHHHSPRARFDRRHTAFGAVAHDISLKHIDTGQYKSGLVRSEYEVLA
jgi:hypothetical protein